MKLTTTLAEFIKSELFYTQSQYQDNHQITFYDNFVYKKVIDYDKDIAYILDKTIFYGLDTLSLDFKKSFITLFYNRVIKFQTIDLFTAKLFGLLYPKINSINDFYTNYQSYLHATSTKTDNTKNTSTNKSNELYSDLPQTQTDISLNIECLPYATNTTLNKSSNVNDNNSVSNSSNFNVENLTKYRVEIENIFNELDKKLFSQFI